MSLLKLNPIEPPWYGPVCPVVWEGWHREVSPYPDHRPEPVPQHTCLQDGAKERCHRRHHEEADPLIGVAQ
jgi:hypothetical protein